MWSCRVVLSCIESAVGMTLAFIRSSAHMPLVMAIDCYPILATFCVQVATGVTCNCPYFRPHFETVSNSSSNLSFLVKTPRQSRVGSKIGTLRHRRNVSRSQKREPLGSTTGRLSVARGSEACKTCIGISRGRFLKPRCIMSKPKNPSDAFRCLRALRTLKRALPMGLMALRVGVLAAKG